MQKCHISGFGWGVRRWISDLRLGPSTRLRLAQDDAGRQFKIGSRRGAIACGGTAEEKTGNVKLRANKGVKGVFRVIWKRGGTNRTGWTSWTGRTDGTEGIV